MVDNPPATTGLGPPALTRSVRIAAGLLAGFGATGIAAGLAAIRTYVEFDWPLVDLSGLILMAPVVLVPFASAAVLRGPVAVASIVIGAVAGPAIAAFATEGPCESTAWLAFALLVLALYILVISGVAALAGDRVGGAMRLRGNRRSAVSLLAPVLSVGIVGWLVAVSQMPHCP